jgi:hypothetical protein
VGEHGGYSEWNDETQSVEYLTRCDKDSNAGAWFENWMDPEDLCAPRYRQLMDSLAASIRLSGASVQIALGSHDLSLQLLQVPRESRMAGVPSIQIISGAGSKVARVSASNPPTAFTSASENPKQAGEAVPGFVQLQFERERLRVRFFNARTGDWMKMNSGQVDFMIGKEGTFTAPFKQAGESQ